MEASERPSYQEGKVVGSVDQEHVDAVLTALANDGFERDRIQIVTAADMEDIESPFERTGLAGFIDRFLLSMGGQLRELEVMREALVSGDVLVAVQVETDEGKSRASNAIRQSGGQQIKYYGTWTVESL